MENTHHARCHCGTVQFEVKLLDGFNTARRCNCSLCRMRGGIAVSARISDIKFIQGKDRLSVYQFHTKEAKHYFCSVCGIYTHHQRRSKPDQFGINVACLEGVSPFDFPEVLVANGAKHAKDPGGKADDIFGVLSFTKS